MKKKSRNLKFKRKLFKKSKKRSILKKKIYNTKSKSLIGLRGGEFKVNQVNETGNNGVITSCINCCSTSECPQPDKFNNVSIVTKVFFNTLEGIAKYNNEIKIGERLRIIDPDQTRFIYSLPKKCIECNVKLKDLSDPIQKVLKKINPFVKDEDTLSNFNMFNMFAVNSYENVSAIPENKKKYLKESLEILHTNGICHMDLHKLNILEGYDRYPRIIDFGESYLFDTKNTSLIDELNKQKDWTTLNTTLFTTPKDINKRRRSISRIINLTNEDNDDELKLPEIEFNYNSPSRLSIPMSRTTSPPTTKLRTSPSRSPPNKNKSPSRSPSRLLSRV